MVVSDPDLIAEYLAEHSPMMQRVGLESGPTSSWLWRELEARGLPAVCIDARHASAALSMQINKSDRNDALGLARIMQTGWFRRVQVKSENSDRIRALLNARSLLVQMRRDRLTFAMMLAIPVLQLVLYKKYMRRGIAKKDCIRITWIGAALLLVYQGWVFFKLPGV